jgi:hypothetical protein
MGKIEDAVGSYEDFLEGDMMDDDEDDDEFAFESPIQVRAV